MKVGNGSLVKLSRIFREVFLRRSEFIKCTILFFRTREVPNWSRSGFYDLIRPDLSGRSTVSGPVKSCFLGQCRRGHIFRDFSHIILNLDYICLKLLLISNIL